MAALASYRGDAAAELAALPPLVRRYFTFMGATGRPRTKSLRTRFTGRFKIGLKGGWQPCEGWTYISREGGAFRFFEMRLKFLGWMPLRVHDVYQDGAGRLSARLFGLFPVASGRGPELDAGELVTFLNDAIMGAPDLLLGPETAWREVDDRTFEVALTDAGNRVSARVTVDERGAPLDFATDDRYFVDSSDPGRPPVRTRWTTPVAGWGSVAGRAVSLGGRATWHFPEGPFTYAELRLLTGSVAFDAPFSARGGAAPPGAVWIVVGLVHAFVALSALFGGGAFLLRPDGSLLGADPAWLARSPFPDYTVPGLILSTLVGVANAAATVAAFRRLSWAGWFSAAVGVTLMGWIAGELLLLRTVHWLQGLYLGLGMFLALAGWALASRVARARDLGAS